jgi:SAM-dependent methyltransferase
MILPQLLARFLKHKDDPVFYRLQAEDAIRWLEVQGVRLGQGVRVLDLGCGHGVFGGELKRRGCEVTFADESNQLQADFRDAPFREVNLDRDDIGALGRYDLVVCSNVFEHLSQPRRFLGEAHRLLTPEGALFLSWTNWLSPWGGHEFSPWHYLGAGLGPRIHDALGKSRFHRPGVNLFVTHIGRTLGWIREDGTLRIAARAPRYYTEFGWLLSVPVVREFLAWNCALLLKGAGRGVHE